jgi:FkbM family methyltransferase
MTIIRKIFKKILSFIPLSIATWVYLKIVEPTPLRYIFDSIIKSSIPNEIILEDSVRMLLNKKDIAISGMISLNKYEPFETQLFKDIVGAGMTVIDIGANIGYFTMIAGKRVGNNGKVFSFEPEENNFSFLKSNVDLNNFKNINIFKLALSDTAERKNLFISPRNTGAYSLVDNRRTNIKVEIETVKLDDILKTNNTTKVDIIKMDIEGGEYRALQGMKDALENNPEIKIITEFYPNALRRFGYEPIEMLTLLKKLGFNLQEIDEDSKKLIPINDFDIFIKSFPKRNFAKNIYAYRD